MIKLNHIIPLAKDHFLNETLSNNTGSDMIISGSKVNGLKFKNKELKNVSFILTNDKNVIVRGFDNNSKSVKSFRLDLVEEFKNNNGDVYNTDSIRKILTAIKESNG